MFNKNLIDHLAKVIRATIPLGRRPATGYPQLNLTKKSYLSLNTQANDFSLDHNDIQSKFTYNPKIYTLLDDYNPRITSNKESELPSDTMSEASQETELQAMNRRVQEMLDSETRVNLSSAQIPKVRFRIWSSLNNYSENESWVFTLSQLDYHNYGTIIEDMFISPHINLYDIDRVDNITRSNMMLAWAALCHIKTSGWRAASAHPLYDTLRDVHALRPYDFEYVLSQLLRIEAKVDSNPNISHRHLLYADHCRNPHTRRPFYYTTSPVDNGYRLDMPGCDNTSMVALEAVLYTNTNQLRTSGHPIFVVEVSPYGC